MSKCSFAAIEARTKLGPKTNLARQGEDQGPNILSDRLTHNITQHNIPVVGGVGGGSLVLKKLAQNAPAELKGRVDKQKRFNNNWKIQEPN